MVPDVTSGGGNVPWRTGEESRGAILTEGEGLGVRFAIRVSIAL